MSSSTAPPSGPPQALVVTTSSLGGGATELSIVGPLRLGWLGRLGGAFSRRGITIVRVTAERDGHGTWQARLEIRALAGGLAMSEFDFIAMLEEANDATPDSAGLSLSSYRLKRTEKNFLELEVIAQDSLGFLSALFGRLGFLGLFAQSIRAMTFHGRIEDTLVLHGIGGEAPSPATEQALGQALSRLCVAPGQGKTPSSSPLGLKTPPPAPPSSKSSP